MITVRIAVQDWSGMRLIDADAIVFTHAIARSIDDGHNWNELCVTKDEIDDMPSAEPEEEVFEWCHDCKEYDQERHCCHRWTKVIRQTVEEMKAESERKWIPVTEALPEEEKDVLVSVHFEGFKGKTVDLPPSDYVEIASHVDGVWSSLSDEYKAIEVNHHVVAWAKLPEPWKGEK